ncbi:MAG: L,D-transpeptidase family protein [Coriobacteriia bacterium]|nr:L,D-transpeptidase family protein [Coriobacteriia bacterium]
MHKASLKVRILATATAVLLLCLSAGSAWAVMDDYQVREVMPTGSAIAGIDVSGMTRDSARDLLQSELVTPLSGPITTRHDDQTFVLPAADLVEIDVEGMIAQTFSPKAEASLLQRVLVRVTSETIGMEVPLALGLDDKGIGVWLADVASQVDKPAIDATISVETTGVTFIASQRGEILDEQEARTILAVALRAGSKNVELPVDYIEPAVTEEDLGKVIFISRSQRKLYLYDNGGLEKSFGVAVGTPSHPTPRGDWVIMLKRYMPAWSNPGSAWAASMPAYIPPGSSNPLGTRALNLDAPGIRIHGTTQDWSIGHAASHGCMRMHRWDIEDLYERVEVGTPVFIR